MSGNPLDRLARNIKRTSSTAWSPRSQQMAMHQGTVNAVDTFNGHADFMTNDPSGLVVPSVRYLQPYTSTNTPSVGDVVWAMHFGTDLLIIGQHIVPVSVVIP
jgi:hypothetical protein